MNRVYYGYAEFLADCRTLAAQMAGYQPDAIVAVSRGGVSLGHLLSEFFDLRTLYTLNAIHYDGTRKLETVEIFNVPDLRDAKTVLVVDEIVDSGETLDAILTLLKSHYPVVAFKSAALFQKPGAAIEADFWVREAGDWIDFFWEIDLAPQSSK
ncbi:MAG: phosphoribosyltransferase [Campylobacterales bacterium]